MMLQGMSFSMHEQWPEYVVFRSSHQSVHRLLENHLYLVKITNHWSDLGNIFSYWIDVSPIIIQITIEAYLEDFNKIKAIIPNVVIRFS
jgi:hypothetical protein